MFAAYVYAASATAVPPPQKATCKPKENMEMWQVRKICGDPKKETRMNLMSFTGDRVRMTEWVYEFKDKMMIIHFEHIGINAVVHSIF